MRAAQGQHSRADILFLKAIEICERALGPHHPMLGITVGNRANVLVQQVRASFPRDDR